MTSSTSSSDDRGVRGLLHVGCFVTTVLAGTVLVHGVWASTPLADHVVLEAIAPGPPSSEHYLSVTDDDAIDGFVYLHELEDVCAPLRAADVVFFGDSRLQFAFRGQVLRNFFGERELKYYLLGFPNGSSAMAEAVLDRCGASPRLAVVFETGFFVERATAFERRMLESSAFDARKARLEFDMAFAVRRRLHRILPHPVGRDLSGGSWILYRDPSDGSWWVAVGSERDIPVTGGPIERVAIPSDQLEAARRFRNEIETSGGRVVLAYVPTSRFGRARAHTIADLLGAPIVDPMLTGLRAADGVHLRAESAEAFAAAFTERLEDHLPETSPVP